MFRKKGLTVCGAFKGKQALSIRPGSDIYSLFDFNFTLNSLILLSQVLKELNLGSQQVMIQGLRVKNVKIKSPDDPKQLCSNHNLTPLLKGTLQDSHP